MQRPGEFRITERALEKMALPSGARILEIGCGEGETLERLRKKGYDVTGIDIDPQAIQKAKERNPGADIRWGDGECLEDFSSFTFDGVIMECVLSLINMPDEALHEIYCVLKKGGKLYFSDLLVKDPGEELIRTLAAEAEKQAQRPRDEGDCGGHEPGESACGAGRSPGGETGGSGESEVGGVGQTEEGVCGGKCDEAYIPSEHEAKLVNFRYGGRLLREPLAAQLLEIGFTDIYFEDCSDELKGYAAQLILENGSLEGCACADCVSPEDYRKTGYFMMAAAKPL